MIQILNSGTPQGSRVWYAFKIFEYIIILCCLLLLPLNQYLSHVHDDFTIAYDGKNKSNGSLQEPQPSGTTPRSGMIMPPLPIPLPPPTTPPTTPTTTTTTTKKATTPTTTISTTTSSTISTPRFTRPHTIPYYIRHRNPRRDRGFVWKATTSIIDEDYIDSEENLNINIFTENPMVILRAKRADNTTNDNDDDDDDSKNKTRMSDLLILYPCCLCALILLGMELCSNFMGDLMTNCTSILLAVLRIGLGITIFVVSLLASCRTKQAVMIVICILSAIFLMFEFVFCILFFKLKK